MKKRIQKKLAKKAAKYFFNESNYAPKHYNNHK